MADTKIVIQALHYILKKLGKADKLKLIKLIFLADKYHLLKYGRTITEDDYYAMKLGPVGSTVKDVLSFNDFTLSETELDYANKFLRQINQDYFACKEELDLDMLSETDRDVLDYVVEKFGKMSSFELSEYSHKYPEWQQHEYLFENGQAKRKQIKTEELLSTIDDDLQSLGIDVEHVEESRNLLLGNFCQGIELPPELVLNVLDNWCICHFKDEKHAPDAPHHFYIVIPLQGSNLVISIITSQVEKKKSYYTKVNIKALNGLVFLNRGEFSFLTRDVSVIDCNQAELLSKAELADRVNSELKIIESQIPKRLKEKVQKAIQESPLVRPHIKKALNFLISK